MPSTRLKQIQRETRGWEILEKLSSSLEDRKTFAGRSRQGRSETPGILNFAGKAGASAWLAVRSAVCPWR